LLTLVICYAERLGIVKTTTSRKERGKEGGVRDNRAFGGKNTFIYPVGE